MKILIVSTFDLKGGAARAAYRLHRALLEQNIESQMLVQNKNSDDYTVITDTNLFSGRFNKLRTYFYSIPVPFFYKKHATHFSSSIVSSYSVIKKINGFNPDVVHLHWICNGFIKIENIAKIKAPIVWSLHDNWAFTGGCHIKWDCDRYIEKCGACPRLESNRENDLSRKVWSRKAKTFSKLPKIVVNGLSKWVADCSRKSSLLKNKVIVNIPNLIDTYKFKPFDKQYSRELWSLPKEKKLILFGAINATSDVNKGFIKLCDALNKLKGLDIELVVYGASEPKNSQIFEYKTHYLGLLNDEVSLVTLYNAVDVIVVPSIQENLSNVIMESLACGTPVVAFNVGGNSDMIEHKKNGYLAQPFDTTDFADGIDFILNNSNYNGLCQNARKKVIENFDRKVVIEKYIELYKEVINRYK